MKIEIPSDSEVLAQLTRLGHNIAAKKLCEALVQAGHPLRESQIAIQRAAERGKIKINDDLSLSPNTKENLVAA